MNRENMYSGCCRFEARIRFQSSVGRNSVLRKHGKAKHKLTASERKGQLFFYQGRKIRKTKWNYWERNQGKKISNVKKKKKIQCNAGKRIVWSWKRTKRWVCCWIRKLFYSWSFPMFIHPGFRSGTAGWEKGGSRPRCSVPLLDSYRLGSV